ncbi:MAG: hypothetical protein K8F91_14890 [Candidatus Obscuribacterales bacterium]|nr:hypothetical protein [Candidatus Obscuribacterales bacterium]
MSNQLKTRAIVYGINDKKGRLHAITVADPVSRSTMSFAGGDVESVQEVLLKYDVLVGISIDKLLSTIGLQAEQCPWRIDISPPQKTKKLNKSGRILKITSELLISGTIGVSRAFGDPQKIAAYIADGDSGKLARRIESTAKTLCAYYNYGRIHSFVRLRWGFLDEIIDVEQWRLPGDPHLYDILRQSKELMVPVEVVIGSAPGWGDPWSRAQQVQVLDLEAWRIIIKRPEEIAPTWIDRTEIQAARLVPATTN